MDIIQRNIPDRRFIKLLKELLEAGYLEDWKYNNTYSGVPQGGIASPILANIYGRLFGRKGTVSSMTS